MNPSRLLLSDADGRLAGIAATMLAHVALILAWQAARQVRLPDDREPASFVQWVRLPDRAPAASSRDDTAGAARRAATTDEASAQVRPGRRTPAPDPVGAPEAAVLPVPAADSLEALPPVADPAAPTGKARQILDRARREVGAIDRALRKERNPTIVAPPDSPQIRMRAKIAEAAALAPNRFWEAPKMEELVNDGGDGARRTRVITAGGVYCITERSPVTSIDTIEKHGKLRITNCGLTHEQPAKPQEWRTARD